MVGPEGVGSMGCCTIGFIKVGAWMAKQAGCRLFDLVILLRIVLDDEALGCGLEELDHAWIFKR